MAATLALGVALAAQRGQRSRRRHRKISANINQRNVMSIISQRRKRNNQLININNAIMQWHGGSCNAAIRPMCVAMRNQLASNENINGQWPSAKWLCVSVKPMAINGWRSLWRYVSALQLHRRRKLRLLINGY
jgi:hypothetical protein